MLNIGGPKYSRKLLVAKVVRSTILYVALVWEEVLAYEDNWKWLNMTYCSVALRVCNALRGISSGAARVIVEMNPRMNLHEKGTVYRKTARR